MSDQKFKKMRRLAGLSQFELAKKAGIDRSTLSLFECGHREPTAEQMKAIEEACVGAAKKRADDFQRNVAFLVERSA